MFSRIIVPVDLAHTENLERAITAAAGIASRNQADLFLVSVSNRVPKAEDGAQTEYTKKLSEYASQQSESHGVTMTAHPVYAADAAAELDRALMTEADKLGADLIVMASHVPGFSEFVFSSNAGYLANHAKISVFVVR